MTSVARCRPNDWSDDAARLDADETKLLLDEMLAANAAFLPLFA